ncbi:hypothetical protein SSX86_016610 [Deinandra increscens subsp. villosa]|uniref:Uncharacterized protein n=1 Tax=Deinandra increscens subsp. villosa TaxID=3103831 RepID=A0AAP0D314_9ASTR
MARLIGLDSHEGGGILKLEGTHIVFMMCMIIVSMSILSLIIFACGDPHDHDKPKKRRHNSGAAAGVIAGIAGSSGGGGGCGGGGGGGC